MVKRILYLVVLVVSSFAVSAQDFHYSQFFNSPLNLNPGLTGVYDGTTRLHLNYKNQWDNVAGYNTFNIGGEYKFDKCNSKRNYLSLGALFNYDRAGDLKLSHAGINLFASYTLSLGQNFSITPGINGGFVSRRLSNDEARWIIEGGNQTPEDYNTSLSYFDLNAGLNFRYQTSFRNILDFGGGLFHINKPETKFFGSNNDTNVEVFQKLNLYAMLNWPLARKFDINVNALLSNQNVYQEILGNVQGKIYLGESFTKALYVGVGARFSEINGSDEPTGLSSLIPIVGLQLGNLKAEINYDILLSKFNHAANGSPELSLQYIIHCVPPQVCKPCPIY